MKEFALSYYLYDQEDEIRRLILIANTSQDAVIIFNLSCGNQATLVNVEELGDKDALGTDN